MRVEGSEWDMQGVRVGVRGRAGDGGGRVPYTNVAEESKAGVCGQFVEFVLTVLLSGSILYRSLAKMF